MNRSRSLTWARLATAAAATLLCAATSQAGTLSFHLDINTASLVGNLNGPFSLDFQLNQGAGNATNSVNLNNFVYAGGNSTGSPSLFGGASGSLSSSVSLSDAGNAFNEFFQGFSAGTTEIDFDASMTTNVDPTTPDAFSVAILDSELFNIPTSGLGDSLLLVNITASNLGLSDVLTFTSTEPDAGVTVAATPEPATLGMALAASLVALGWKARKSARR